MNTLLNNILEQQIKTEDSLPVRPVFLGGTIFISLIGWLAYSVYSKIDSSFVILTVGIFSILLFALFYLLVKQRRSAQAFSEYIKQTLQKTEAKNKFLASIVEHSNDAIITRDLNGIVTSWNPGATRLYGYTAEEAVGQPLQSLHLSHCSESELAQRLKRIQAAENQYFEATRLCQSGEEVVVSITLSPLFNDQGHHCGEVGIARNVSERLKTEWALRESEQRLRLIADNIPALVAYIDNKQYYRFNNRVFADWFGPKWANLEGRTVREVYGEEVYSIIQEHIEAALAGRQVSYERKLLETDIPRYVHVSYIPDIDEDKDQKEVKGFYLLAYDITERKEAEERIRHMAHHDPLTGLPNRIVLHDRIDLAIERAKRGGDYVGMLFVDLDCFKHINDSWGHPVGDRALQIVAQRIAGCLRKIDTIARIGGDEFVVLLPDLKNAQDAAYPAGAILNKLAQPCSVDGCLLHITPSIGISVYPEDGASLEMLMKAADTAMYEAKKQGRNNYQFYNSKPSPQTAPLPYMEFIN